MNHSATELVPLDDTGFPPDAFHVSYRRVSAALRQHVSALVGVEVRIKGPIPLAVAPHDSLPLIAQFGCGTDPIEEKAEHGLNTSLTGIRNNTGAFLGAGNCVTLFAMLTPLGAVHLLDSRPLAKAPRIKAEVAGLLDRSVTRALESDLALARGLDTKLDRFADWLERRAARQRRQSTAALRAARAAKRLAEEPAAAMETLAAEQHVSRRQLDRDFALWIGTSAGHFAQVTRLQNVSRRAYRGGTLADIAADAGFADQAHMSRVVRKLTGLTPTRFLRSSGTPMVSAFRAATGGTTVYL